MDPNAQNPVSPTVPSDQSAGVQTPPVVVPVEEPKVEGPVVTPGTYVPPAAGTPEPVATPPVEEKPADQQTV